jgi:hypothetical protein
MIAPASHRGGSPHGHGDAFETGFLDPRTLHQPNQSGSRPPPQGPFGNDPAGHRYDVPQKQGGASSTDFSRPEDVRHPIQLSSFPPPQKSLGNARPGHRYDSPTGSVVPGLQASVSSSLRLSSSYLPLPPIATTAKFEDDFYAIVSSPDPESTHQQKRDKTTAEFT